MHDVIVIGYGPAGCTAAVFSVRRNLRTLVLSDPSSLSQLEEATVVDDWPGSLGIHGVELMESFRKHTKKLGAEVVEDKALSIEKTGKGFEVKTEKRKYQGRTVIIATGARHRKALIPGEERLSGKGVSYCATCDGPLFKGKKVFVIGGGDTAVTYALLLEQIGAETTLVHRRDQLRATEIWQKKILKSKVRFEWDSMITEIQGRDRVESVKIKNKKTGKEKVMPADGVFVSIGTVPTSELAKKLNVRLNEWGFIETDKYQKTNVPGIFAGGDCTDSVSKKIVVACGSGAVAAESAYNYLKEGE